MDVLARIEELRKQKGWTMYKLGNEAGLTPSTLTNMYTRGTSPSIGTLSAICAALGVSRKPYKQQQKAWQSSNCIQYISTNTTRKRKASSQITAMRLLKYVQVYFTFTNVLFPFADEMVITTDANPLFPRVVSSRVSLIISYAFDFNSSVVKSSA